LNKIHVGLIFGGRSGEHEVSIRGAESVREALGHGRYAVQDFYISKDGKWQPRPLLPEPGANPGLDVVFPLLHGTFGALAQCYGSDLLTLRLLLITSQRCCF